MRHFAKALLITSMFAATPAFAAAEKYTIDPSHTYVLFSINHLGFSDTVGRFDDTSGTLMLDHDAPEKSTVSASIKVASINTVSKDLNEHLQKPDWFDAAKYPEMKFVSTSVKLTGKDTADITGDLTLHGVTKPVTLKAKLNKADYFQMMNAWVAGFNAETTIKRSDFGMAAYVPMVSDEVKITISTEFHNKEKPAPAPADAKKK